MSEPRAIAVVRSGQAYNAYDALLQALLKRRNELGVSGETLDDITGQPTRYSQKLLDGTRMFGRKSFGDMLGGLAVQIVIIEDEDALKLIKDRLGQSPLDAAQVRMLANASMRTTRWLFTPRKGRKAAKDQSRNMTPKQRTKRAKHAAKLRWHKPKIVEITNEDEKNAILEAAMSAGSADSGPGTDADQPARVQGIDTRSSK